MKYFLLFLTLTIVMTSTLGANKKCKCRIQGKCLKVGDTATQRGECQGYECTDKGLIARSCPVIQSFVACSSAQEPDLSKPFPDCCPLC